MIDYHIHLEEGPYSYKWLERTYKSIAYFGEEDHHLPQSRAWIEQVLKSTSNRISKGAYCSEWLDLYLRRAIQLGLKEVGIVDHLYRFKEAKSYFKKFMNLNNNSLGNIQSKWLEQVCNEELDRYVTFILGEKEKWASAGVQLKLGMEADYFIGGEAELELLLKDQPWDYIIGSVHFVDGWGFDNPKTQHLFEAENLIKLYDNFFTAVEGSIKSKLFDIIAHLDNIKVFNFRPDEALLIPRYKKIAQLLKDYDLATERNAGLLYRYPIKEMCPSRTYLQVLMDYNIPITLSSDSHYPDDLGNYIFTNIDELKSLGVKEIATFSNRKRKMIEI